MSPGWPNRRRLSVTVALIALVAVPLPAQGSEPAAVGVLVLRNGNVLHGTVRAADDFYSVEHAGASLQVPAEQVEMACRTLEEAYEQRRTSRVGSSADAHLELARWCLRHGLLDQAAREVLDARTRDPGHPALPTLDSAIQWAIELKRTRKPQSAEAAQVEAAAEAPMTQAPATPAPDVSIEVQTRFVRSIQPMLVQNCAVGGCHQPGADQQMQLDRWALEGNGNPELIRRNLKAVLRQIDIDDPASSAVMIRSRQSHGSGRHGLSKPLAAHQAALLLQWLSEAAGVQPADPTEVTEPPQTPGVEDELSVDDTRSAAAAVPPPNPAAAPAFKPRDAFDPEIFNRRMAAKAPSMAVPVGHDKTDDAEIESAIRALEQTAATAPAAPE
jgi:hypothetical protein